MLHHKFVYSHTIVCFTINLLARSIKWYSYVVCLLWRSGVSAASCRSTWKKKKSLFSSSGVLVQSRLIIHSMTLLSHRASTLAPTLPAVSRWLNLSTTSHPAVTRVQFLKWSLLSWNFRKHRFNLSGSRDAGLISSIDLAVDRLIFACQRSRSSVTPTRHSAPGGQTPKAGREGQQLKTHFAEAFLAALINIFVTVCHTLCHIWFKQSVNQTASHVTKQRRVPLSA